MLVEDGCGRGRVARGGHGAAARRTTRTSRRPGGTAPSMALRALPERGAARAHTVDEGGQVVVECPADARARDEQRGDRSGPAAFPGEHAASDDDASHPEPASVAEVFAEECHAEERR